MGEKGTVNNTNNSVLNETIGNDDVMLNDSNTTNFNDYATKKVINFNIANICYRLKLKQTIKPKFYE